MKAAAVILALGAAAFALPAAAQMSNMMSNLYVGGTAGQASYRDDPCANIGGGSTCDDKDTAWRALVGYQLNSMFAVEGGYHDLGGVTVSMPGSPSASIDTRLWELLGIAMMPFDRFSVFLKLGGYHASIEADPTLGMTDDTKNGWTYGAGAGFEVMKNLGLRLEWQRYREVGGTPSSNIDVLSVGAVWRFR